MSKRPCPFSSKKLVKGGNLMDDPVPNNVGPLGLTRDCKAAGNAFDKLKKQDKTSSYDALAGRQMAAWRDCSPVWNNNQIDTKRCNDSRENLAKLDEAFCNALSKYDGTALTTAAKANLQSNNNLAKMRKVNTMAKTVKAMKTTVPEVKAPTVPAACDTFKGRTCPLDRCTKEKKATASKRLNTLAKKISENDLKCLSKSGGRKTRKSRKTRKTRKSRKSRK
jgi:hypothetical protein